MSERRVGGGTPGVTPREPGYTHRRVQIRCRMCSVVGERMRGKKCERESGASVWYQRQSFLHTDQALET